jgi:hypothetical protein
MISTTSVCIITMMEPDKTHPFLTYYLCAQDTTLLGGFCISPETSTRDMARILSQGSHMSRSSRRNSFCILSMLLSITPFRGDMQKPPRTVNTRTPSCKSFCSVGESWIIKWAVKRVKMDKNDENHEVNYLSWLHRPFPDTSLVTHLISHFLTIRPFYYHIYT